MNRNNRNTKGKTLQQTSHTQSLTKTKINQQNIPKYVSNQIHFLQVNPTNSKLSKTSKNCKSKFQHHFASTTQLISTPFQRKAYVPPHLNSSQVFTCINSECQNWKICPSSASKKMDYDSLYNDLQLKYEKAVPCGSRLKKWTVGSKIKNMVQDDRTRYQFRKPYKLFMQQKSDSQPEDVYMNDSQISSHCQEQINSKVNQNYSVQISINEQSRMKKQSNNISTFAQKKGIKI